MLFSALVSAQFQAKMPVFFPEEVVVEILCRLPIKSLLQCTSVCRSWNSLIKSSAFISAHINRSISSTKQQPLFLLRRCSSPSGSAYFEEHYSLRFDDKDFTQHQQLHFPSFRCYHSCFHVVGSCNGLVCLADDILYDLNKFILWNPSIRKFLILPEPSLTIKTCSPLQATLQFGYDPRTDDYKIVRMKSFLGCQPDTEVFSLNRGSWKAVSSIGSTHSGDAGGSPSFVNGTLHWLAYKKRQDAAGYYNVVLGFDVGDETFGELMMPESSADAAPRMLSVMAYGESSIAVVHYDTYRYDRTHHMCHLWVMREYGNAGSWIKLFSSGIQGEDLPRIMGFRKNGDILAEADGELVSIDSDSFQVKHLEIPIKKDLYSLLYDPTATYGDGDYTSEDGPPPLCNPPVADISFLGSHVESLVLLNNGQNDDDLNDESDDESD